MNRNRKVLAGLMSISLIFVLASNVTAATATAPAAKVVIQYAATAPKIDGKIDKEWSKVKSYESKKVMLDKSKGFTKPDSADDLSVNWKVMWDKNNIYFLAEVTDDVKGSGKKNDHAEGVEMYIDGDNDRGKWWWEDDTIISMSYKMKEFEGGTGENWWAPGKLNTKGAKFVIADTKKGYIVEMSFPWSNINAKDIMADKFIGFDVHVSDNDDGGKLRDHKLTFYSKSDDTWQNPSLMANAKLASPSKK